MRKRSKIRDYFTPWAEKKKVISNLIAVYGQTFFRANQLFVI